jgi:hypothetical protein
MIQTGTGRTWSISEQNIVLPFIRSNLSIHVFKHTPLTVVKPNGNISQSFFVTCATWEQGRPDPTHCYESVI